MQGNGRIDEGLEGVRQVLQRHRWLAHANAMQPANLRLPLLARPE
jgi:hypothetical protein